MKVPYMIDRIIIGTALAALFVALYFLFGLLTTPANAGVFDSLMTGDMETVVSEAYKVEAYGYDMRVYEWHPKSAPNMTCITGFSEKANIGLQCFETSK
jgi:hypothetical protein